MPDNIIQINKELIHTELKDLVKNSVEETLNAMLDAEADKLVNAERYARDEERQGYRAGHYDRNFSTTAGDVKLKMPKLKGVAFETAIIERYRRRETSVEEALMHIRIDYRNGGKRHVAYCSEYHKGKAKNPKCHSPHIIDADLLMQTVAEVLKKIEDYSISNRAEFEALVKKNLAMQQTDQTKKQQKRIPQITTRLEQIDKVLNKLYEDNALGTIPQDRYEQMSQK